MTKKQEFLDQEAGTNEIFVTQQLLLKHSKTKLTQLRRAMKEINDTIYKSWAKSMPFEEIYGCIIAADDLNKIDNDLDNETDMD